ncbi:MAG: zf-HC2 domain-containing protein [bacterium]
MSELLEAYLDNALADDEKQLVSSHLQACDSCQIEHRFAQQVAQSLRKLPAKPCPQLVSEAVIAAAKKEHAGLWQNLVSAWRQRFLKPAWRPVLATAAIAVLVILATLTLDRQKPQTPQISPDELARVELDVKWTLAYLGNLSKKTGLSVRDKVIEPEVVAPLYRALRTVMVTGAEK